MGDVFIVARNPDAASSLPFLLRLPIDGGLWLKARESWPRASRVYCHPCSDPPPPEALVELERVPIASCVRRGPAIDLVLQRGVNRRAQFVFTTAHGRAMILWQTPKVAALARPGVRVPFRNAASLDRIVIDTRERYGYTFRSANATIERAALRHGDYAAFVGTTPVAVVERKSADDFKQSLVDGKLAFVLAELSGLPSAAIVVETSYAALLRAEHVSGAFLADLLARLHVRYPAVPIVFVENRALGERWTHAFFAAAAGERDPNALPLSALVLEPVDPPKRRRARKAPRRAEEPA